MRSRFYIEDPAPEAAEIYGNLKFYRYQLGVKPCAKAWRGRQGRPYANYTFTSEESREAWIARQKAGEDEAVARKAAYKQEKAARKLAMADQIKVGTILHGS
jgi:hypothetical protein